MINIDQQPPYEAELEAFDRDKTNHDTVNKFFYWLTTLASTLLFWVVATGGF